MFESHDCLLFGALGRPQQRPQLVIQDKHALGGCEYWDKILKYSYFSHKEFAVLQPPIFNKNPLSFPRVFEADVNNMIIFRPCFRVSRLS